MNFAAVSRFCSRKSGLSKLHWPQDGTIRSSIFDFSDETENSAYSQWLTEKRDERREDQQQVEAEEDRHADEILKKLHGGSLSSLTEEERSILDRVSARIRRRRQQGV